MNDRADSQDQNSVYGPYGQDGAPGAPYSATLERVTTGPEQPRMRMRNKFPFFGGSKSPQSAVLDPLFAVVRANHPQANFDKITRAFAQPSTITRGRRASPATRTSHILLR